jgi:hypothetical protein
VSELLPYLLAFYILDGLLAPRRGEWLFIGLLGRFRAQRPGLTAAGLVPFAEVLAAWEPPLRWSREGVRIAEAQTSVSYEDLAGCSASERRVVCGGRTIHDTPSPAAARHLQSLLVEIARAAPEARAGRLRLGLAARMDLEAVRALRARLARPRRVLQILGTMLGLVLFAVLPASVYAPERLPLAPVQILGAAALVYAAIVGVAWSSLRRAGLDRSAALAALSPILLFPPAAVHATGVVHRDLYTAFDPLAVAAALLPEAEFRERARRRLGAAALESEHEAEPPELRKAREQAWDALLAAAGTSARELLGPRASADASAAAYCPLCAAEYRTGFGQCADCRVPLRPLALASTAPHG